MKRLTEATMSTPTELLDKVTRLKLILIQRATGGIEALTEFVQIRRELMAEPSIKGKLPGFLKYCTDLGEFWAHIKEKFSTYRERRAYIRDQFLPVITMLEGGAKTPSDPAISEALSKVDSEHVREAWQKALE